jgi:hypothetical protein
MKHWNIDWQRVPVQLQRETLEKFEAVVAAKYDPEWEMLRSEGPGHTDEVRGLASVHDGRATAEWLALRYMLHGASESELPVIEALARMQVTKENDNKFGCSRWYGEETKPADTNAAFFIARLLVVRWMLEPNVAKGPVGALLLPYFKRSAVWFAHECKNPILYYPNKIISDGCLSYALAHILNDNDLLATAESFLDRWCTYTEKRGWGWGENTSLGYAGVMLDAFWLALYFLPAGDLRKRILALQDELIENLAFHAPNHPVPGIRSYNFLGETRYHGGVYAVLGLTEPEANTAPAWLSALLLQISGNDVNKRVAQMVGKNKKSIISRRNQRIFDDVSATTYIEGGGRLGTINRFPALPGCNQHPNWGLGWQSMPTAFLIDNIDFGFLQWETKMKDDKHRTHPSSGFLTGYASPALFAEKWLPEMISSSSQQDRVAVTVRTVMHLSNNSKLLADQWRIPSFSGQCHVGLSHIHPSLTETTDSWVIMLYKGYAVAVRALQSMPYGFDSPMESNIHVEWDNDTLQLRQYLYNGKAKRLEQERIECGWITILVPNVNSYVEAHSCLSQYQISENWMEEGDIPRQQRQFIRKVKVTAPGVNVELSVDPWALPRT